MNKSYLHWVELTRIIAAFLVVLSHSVLLAVYHYDHIYRMDWLIAVIYNSLTRACVPLFFMLSGFLFLNKNETLNEFLSKRIPRILVPLIGWSAFYVFWNAYYEKAIPLSISSVLRVFLTPAHYHLWFLYALLGNYLFIPILKVFLDNSTKKIQYYYLSLWVLAVSIIPFFEDATGLISAIDMKMISGYVGYLLLGHLMGNMNITRKHLVYSVFILLFCLGVTILGTYYLSEFQGRYVGYFFHYLSPNVIILSLTSFLLIKGIAEKSVFLSNPVFEKTLRSLGSACFGIYLIHPIFLYILQKGSLGFKLSALDAHLIFKTAVATFITSFVFIYFLKKVPLIKQLVN